MKQINDLQKLDRILKYLATIQQPNSFREFYEMKKELAANNFQYDEFELWIIMDKLCKDKYVSTEAKYVNYVEANTEQKFTETQRLDHRFYITYEGRMFIGKKLGGYKWEARKEFSNTIFQLTTTALLTIGTFGLLIWELIKYFYHCR